MYEPLEQERHGMHSDMTDEMIECTKYLELAFALHQRIDCFQLKELKEEY